MSARERRAWERARSQRELLIEKTLNNRRTQPATPTAKETESKRESESESESDAETVTEAEAETETESEGGERTI